MPRKSGTKAPTAAARERQVESSAGASTLNISAVSEPVRRVQRERKARTMYSPTTPVRNRAGANKRAPVKAADAVPPPQPPPRTAQGGTSHSTAAAKKSPAQSTKASNARNIKAVVQKQQQVNQPLSEDASKSSQETGTPEYKKLEGRIRGQVKRLRYHLAFVEAYAAEGWRRASREKLKPSNELEIANSKILKDKRAVLNTLAELQRTNASDTQYPQLAASVATAADEQQLGLLPEDIYCSRCGSTDADENNDILICDSDGCQRAYHQQCQRPWLKTQDIPVDDEHWYCEVCLAVFNSLKLINSAFGTTCDTVQELFPELDQEEQQYGYGGGYEEEDEDEDDDFVDDAEDDDNSGDESEDSDTVEDDEPTLGQQGEHGDDELQMDADAGEISDQELKYLRRTDVIDLNSRSMRSNSKLKQTMTAPRTSALLGQRAAKVVDFETGAVVFGVIVDELEEQEQWHVVYYNDTMELLTHDQALAAIACANAHEHQHATQTRGDMDADADASDPKLILHGKRKRTQVNYRELNDAMFAGKADSDEEAEDATGASRGGTTGAAGDEALGGEVESDDEDYVPEAKTKSSKTGKNGESGVAETQADEETNTPGKRSRRERKSVDYHALNEGLLSY